ncbi:hypothetical protein [Daejeonella sp.]|uniref:hypothetical protein n=1 Tax=Daejeonella sp. TaxID=2805397 RepID=UPI00271DF430|nr:hypothetical protein [Daejeonella sp.]MDO8994558.1 hypothetical protein [Daejeonella sp.]MDP2412486.1 hypothetical protein [Daejeonella sp.]
MKINIIQLGYTFGGALFISMTLTSCQIDKFLNRQKSKMQISEDQKTMISSELQARLRDSHTIRLSDSTGHIYEVDIFPVDTFSFSLENGFKGKAFSISIKGKQNVLRSLIDSSNRPQDVHNLEMDNIEFSRRMEQNTDSKIKEKESRIAFSKIIMVLVSLLILIAGWRYWRGINTI